jgi:hypothetical protein
MSYYRNPRTAGEMRAAGAVEDREFIRSARSLSNIPHAWDDKYACRERCWKAQRKTRKAWGRM